MNDTKDTTPPLTEPREMRVALQKYARGYDWLDDRSLNRPAFGCTMARNILDHAHYVGLSGEDAMTMLAYHALRELDRFAALELNRAMLDVSPRFIVEPSSVGGTSGKLKKHEGPCWRNGLGDCGC